MTEATRAGSTLYAPVPVRRWPGERPLFVVCIAVSLVLWLVMAITVVGLVYGLMIAFFFFVIHLAFIAHVRGNAVRIGPSQFPELHERIQQIAQRIGMAQVPDAYLIHGGGSLNAFATKFARSHMIVLFTDLLEACGDNHAARDMIIGHELGHIHAGHLRWRWLILPASFIPFLGTALSRAREYTCDRFGALAANDQDGALLGLTILAAGGKLAPEVNRASYVAQRTDLNTGFMRLGEWLSTHPPLARRIVALDPRFGTVRDVTRAGTVRAVAILAVVAVLPVALAVAAATRLPDLLSYFQTAANAPVAEDPEEEPYIAPAFDVAIAEWNRSVEMLSSLVGSAVQQGQGIPATYAELALMWQIMYPGDEIPFDPFDGSRVGYDRTPTGFALWSSGPDQRAYTHDDLVHRFELPSVAASR